MPHPQLDRFTVRMKSLKERKNKKLIDRDHVAIHQLPSAISNLSQEITLELIERIVKARKDQKPVMVVFGAHTIKNGLAPVLIQLINNGWITHLAANGAGIIHDWEFSYQGASSEDVRTNVDRGQFGNWQETGYFINLALNIGAYEGKGYGESIGAMIENEILTVPTETELKNQIQLDVDNNPSQVASAADILSIIKLFHLKPGVMEIPHPWKKYSVQAAAFRKNIPFTGHPMFGHDIIYNHPMNHGGLLGRAALRDFLTFAESVSRINGGVYISIGSSVMSPMIFEKSLSMAQNIAIQKDQHIDQHYICVVDLAENHWDWRNGEPPEENPAYYLRYNKTFSRMGGAMRYIQADNRDFLLLLLQQLQKYE